MQNKRYYTNLFQSNILFSNKFHYIINPERQQRMRQIFLQQKQQTFGHLDYSTVLSKESLVHYLMTFKDMFQLQEDQALELYDILAQGSPKVTVEQLDDLLNHLFKDFYEGVEEEAAPELSQTQILDLLQVLLKTCFDGRTYSLHINELKPKLEMKVNLDSSVKDQIFPVLDSMADDKGIVQRARVSDKVHELQQAQLMSSPSSQNQDRQPNVAHGQQQQYNQLNQQQPSTTDISMIHDQSMNQSQFMNEQSQIFNQSFQSSMPSFTIDRQWQDKSQISPQVDYETVEKLKVKLIEHTKGLELAIKKGSQQQAAQIQQKLVTLVDSMDSLMEMVKARAQLVNKLESDYSSLVVEKNNATASLEHDLDNFNQRNLELTQELQTMRRTIHDLKLKQQSNLNYQSEKVTQENDFVTLNNNLNDQIFKLQNQLQSQKDHLYEKDSKIKEQQQEISSLTSKLQVTLRTTQDQHETYTKEINRLSQGGNQTQFGFEDDLLGLGRGYNSLSPSKHSPMSPEQNYINQLKKEQQHIEQLKLEIADLKRQIEKLEENRGFSNRSSTLADQSMLQMNTNFSQVSWQQQQNMPQNQNILQSLNDQDKAKDQQHSKKLEEYQNQLKQKERELQEYKNREEQAKLRENQLNNTLNSMQKEHSILLSKVNVPKQSAQCQTSPIAPEIKEIIKEIEIEKPVYFDVEGFEQKLNSQFQQRLTQELQQEKQKSQRALENSQQEIREIQEKLKEHYQEIQLKAAQELKESQQALEQERDKNGKLSHQISQLDNKLGEEINKEPKVIEKVREITVEKIVEKPVIIEKIVEKEVVVEKLVEVQPDMKVLETKIKKKLENENKLFESRNKLMMEQTVKMQMELQQLKLKNQQFYDKNSRLEMMLKKIQQQQPNSQSLQLSQGPPVMAFDQSQQELQKQKEYISTLETKLKVKDDLLSKEQQDKLARTQEVEKLKQVCIKEKRELDQAIFKLNESKVLDQKSQFSSQFNSQSQNQSSQMQEEKIQTLQSKLSQQAFQLRSKEEQNQALISKLRQLQSQMTSSPVSTSPQYGTQSSPSQLSAQYNSQSISPRQSSPLKSPSKRQKDKSFDLGIDDEVFSKMQSNDETKRKLDLKVKGFIQQKMKAQKKKALEQQRSKQMQEKQANQFKKKEQAQNYLLSQKQQMIELQRQQLQSKNEQIEQEKQRKLQEDALKSQQSQKKYTEKEVIFLYDYLKMAQNQTIRRVLQEKGEDLFSQRQPIFSDQIGRINSLSKRKVKTILVSDSSIHIFTPGKQLDVYSFKESIPFTSIAHIKIDARNNSVFSVSIVNKHDELLECFRRDSLLLNIKKKFQSKNRSLSIQKTDRFYIQNKNQDLKSYNPLDSYLYRSSLLGCFKKAKQVGFCRLLQSGLLGDNYNQFMLVLNDLGILAFSLDKMELFRFIPLAGNQIIDPGMIDSRPAVQIVASKELESLLFECLEDKRDWVAKMKQSIEIAH